MTIRLTHARTAVAPDSNDGKVSSDAWNDNHNATGAPGTLLGFDAAGNATERGLQTLTPDNPLFGATRYDPSNEVDATAALQAFFDHAATPQNARKYVYDASGEWMVRDTIYACYWDGGEPNVERRFIAPTLRFDAIANLPGGVALDYAMEVAGLRQNWQGLLAVHETGAVNQYANTTYATRRFKRGVHVRCFGNSTMCDVAVDGARRDAVHFEGWEAGFTVNGITFSTGNSIGAKFGRINGRYCGSSDHAGSNQAPAPITASARVQGKNTGTAYSAEVFAVDATDHTDAQRTKITCASTAEIELNDLVWCRVELTAAIYGTIAADSGAGTITWSTGDPTNLDGSGNGLQVGELYPIFQGGENVGKVFRICSFGGTSNRTITVGVANPEDTYALVSHAATASATYVQYGTKSPHWVAQVIDSTHFTVSPWVPARMNSTFHVITGAAFKAEGDDISTVEVGPVHGLLCGTSLYTKGNFAPQYAAVLGESCGAAIRWGDPNYSGGQGLVIGGGHAEGNDFDLVAGYHNGTGTINMQSYFDLSKCYGYSPHASVNETELAVTRQPGNLQVFHQGMLIESSDAGTFESRSGATVVTNSPRLRKLYAHDQNPSLTIGADFDIARLFCKHHWAEIVWTAATGGAPGTMTLTLHSTLAGMGWAFAGEGSGSTYTITNPPKPVKLSLYYLFATKKVSIRRDTYFDVTLPLDFLNNVGMNGSLSIGKSSAAAFSNVDGKELFVTNTTGYGFRAAMNGATSQLYLQNIKPFVGYSEFHIEGSPIILSGDGGSNATLTLSGTGGAVIGTLSATSTVSGSNLTTGGFPASVATATVIGRSAGGTGAASALTTIPTGTVPAFAGGDVTSAGGSLTLTVASNAITFAKFQQVAASSLVGNPTGSLANAQGITLSADLAFSGTALQVGAYTGDVAKSAGALATTVAAKGSSGNLQYNNATVRAGAANLNVDASGNLAVAYASATTTPAADSLSFVPQRLLASGGRVLPRFQDETGVLSTMQPHLGRNGIAWMQGTGSTTATISGINMTAAGTATSRVPATTNRLTRTRRLQYLSAATAGSSGGLYSGSLSAYSLGSGTVIGGGGFLAVFRWGASDPATVAGAHMFVGMQNSIAAPVAATDPSTLTNIVGVAQLNGGANLNIVYGGSAAQTAIDLGANFPAAGASTDLYELILYAPPTLNNTVYYRVERINTANVASGTLTGTAGTVLPSNSTLVGPRLWRSNNATALAVGIDIAGFSVESDF